MTTARQAMDPEDAAPSRNVCARIANENARSGGRESEVSGSLSAVAGSSDVADLRRQTDIINNMMGLPAGYSDRHVVAGLIDEENLAEARAIQMGDRIQIMAESDSEESKIGDGDESERVNERGRGPRMEERHRPEPEIVRSRGPAQPLATVPEECPMGASAVAGPLASTMGGARSRVRNTARRRRR